MRTVAVVCTYPELIAALRARCDALAVPLETIDAVAGLADRLCSKILAPKPQKFLGPASWTIVAALGLRIALVEDRSALIRLRRLSKWQRRKPGARMLGRKPARARASKAKHAKWGVIGGRVRAVRLTPGRRVAIARHAAEVRWRNAYIGKTKNLKHRRDQHG